MCYNPIRIRNKGLSHDAGLYHIDVPCGRCKECQDVKSIDYFLRAFSIFRSLPQNWSCFFVTFTHRPADVPRSDFYEESVDDETGEIIYNKVFYNCVCFNHEYIHKALKSLSQYYRRKFPNDYVVKTRSNGVEYRQYLKEPKYLITSEFGESEKGQHLPHYHGILFIPENLNFRQFKELLENYWTYGFTKDIKIHKFATFLKDRSPENCIKYVTKYACKGTGFVPAWLKLKHKLIPSLGDWYQVEPRVFTSNNFGDSLEKLLDVSNYETNKITLSVAGKFCSYNLPSYYSRRFFTRSIVDVKYKEKRCGEIYPFRVVKSKTVFRKVQHTEYLNNYLELKKSILKTQLSSKWFNVRLHFLEMKPEFQDFLCKQKGYNNNLRELVLNTSSEQFVDSFLKVNWSDTPVYLYDYDYTSRPTLEWIPESSKISYNFCKMYEQGLMPLEKKNDYDSYLSWLKNLPDTIKLPIFAHKSNKDYNVLPDRLSSDTDMYHSNFLDDVFQLSYALDIVALYSRLSRKSIQDKKLKDEESFYKSLC